MAPTKDKKTEDTEAKVEVIRPSDLASTLEVSPKALRGFLRREFPRGDGQKNTSWALTEEMVEKATAHFTPSEDEDAGEE